MERDYKNEKVYWLEGFEGPCKGGTFFRSRISKDVEDFEKKFGQRIVGIKLDEDYESGKASFNVEFILEAKEGDTDGD